MIELILQIALIINGLFLSRVGVVYIFSPLQTRPTETVGQERQIFTLREANPGPLDGLRFMLTTKLGINVSHLAITKYILHPAANVESCKIHQCQTFQRPRVEVQSQWGYKNEVLNGPGLDLLHILVPLYGGSLFTIGIFNLTAFFLFEIKESSYVLLASGICFWLGTIFVRSTFSKKTLNHYKTGLTQVGGQGGQVPSRFFAENLTLSLPGGQIMPTTVLNAPSDFQTLRRPCKKGRNNFLDSLHALVGLACLIAGILGCAYG